MGYILPEIYKSIVQETGQDLLKVFIETGTFKGGIPHRILETYKELDPCFEKYYTIELGTDIAKIASKRYKYFEAGNFQKELIHTDELDNDFKNTQSYFKGRLILINNDSVQALKELMPIINEPVCFWLDAHAGAQKYARGAKDVPLLQELEVIKNHHIKNHIIAIDDAHMFGTIQYDKEGKVACDYSEVPYDIVKSYIESINDKYDVGIYEPYQMKMLLAFVK
jgi:hypothetical protein